MLDCTLRDGGCINNFEFGTSYMRKILSALEASGVEIIELGYIDEKKGSEWGRTQFANETCIPENYNLEKKENVSYVAMIDYGKFSPDQLLPRQDSGIDGIRLAFHKKNRKDILKWGRQILDKGYQLYIQPMTCLRYSDSEFIDLIKDINTELPEVSAFYIVDSFGEMRLNDLNRITNLVDHNLDPDIAMGLHSHNNLQLSYSNAVTLLNFFTKRNLILDSSIMGMGKGAGNMNTELFAEHLNKYYEKKYSIRPLLEVIDTVINQIRENYTWGYAVEYYLSAANHCTPSYAGFFYNKHTLSIKQVSDLLQLIDEEKKVSFDKEYAENLYYKYNAQNYNDISSIDQLKKVFENKKVLLIGPGRSIEDSIELVQKTSESSDVITVALNYKPQISVDYIFVTKKVIMDLISYDDAKLITTSNVEISDKVIPVNQSSWTSWSGGKSDSALILIVNILKEIGVNDIALAGCDGFSPDLDANYSDQNLKRPVTKEQALRRNERASTFLKEMSEVINIEFLTPSLYKI